MWDIYTMKYYSDLKIKKTLPFVTTCLDLKDIMLSELSQSQKDKYYDFFHVRYLKCSDLHKQKINWWLPWGGENGKLLNRYKVSVMQDQ